jgi:hypothetical protein
MWQGGSIEDQQRSVGVQSQSLQVQAGSSIWHCTALSANFFHTLGRFTHLVGGYGGFIVLFNRRGQLFLNLLTPSDPSIQRNADIHLYIVGSFPWVVARHYFESPSGRLKLWGINCLSHSIQPLTLPLY